MKIVRFPIYYECVAYHELELPDHVDAEDEDAVKDYISEHWEELPFPDDTDDIDFVSEENGFDWASAIKVTDSETGDELWM